ncbi:TPA: DUF6088 family protein [Streptococcus agalactiae]|uniref:DUF6088 family protein n=1 Tax=Bacteria TaxID=2 RepID=UPI0001BC63A2|nr:MULTISPECIES: DUF6088 family protein [Bacteria]MBS6063596.1 hypothetical protein [Peptostreptococcaceae bacterium]MDU2502638.1 DUF6088 family protein [Peptoniphilus harei]HEN9959598.1 hypothetical protein [Streptococcus agalactiae]EFS28115.2 hypothetical protein FGAG_00436 [Fusobacterium gonidiaformans ATCC 25563]KXB66951.1 hypothetical protein HMPREF3181_00468 [Parvimonas sp. KA00067]
MDSITNQIETIMSENQGKIFSINDFYDLGTKNTIKSILYRLNEENEIARLLDGLYTKPKYSKILNEYSYPDASAVAEKIADKFSWTIAPTGDTALNYTGLSTQVPNEYVYISDGAYREYLYRDKKIIFKHTTNRNITSYSKELSILIQAIKALGKDNISEEDIKKLAVFAKEIQEDLIKDTLKLPFWIQEVLNKIQEINHE